MISLSNNYTLTHFESCIAIPGLASHPFGSWKSRGANADFMWLRDGLPRDFPNVRSILYGYDTKLLQSQSFQTIDDIAITLARALKRLERSHLSAKPAVFLAHSLGGLILKKTFVELAGCGDGYRSILENLEGAILFGVPSKGMNCSCLFPMVEGQPNQKLIEDLSPDSKFLQTLEEQFHNIAALRSIRLVSVYETLRSKTAKVCSSNDVHGRPHLNCLSGILKAFGPDLAQMRYWSHVSRRYSVKHSPRIDFL